LVTIDHDDFAFNNRVRRLAASSIIQHNKLSRNLVQVVKVSEICQTCLHHHVSHRAILLNCYVVASDDLEYQRKKIEDHFFNN